MSGLLCSRARIAEGGTLVLYFGGMTSAEPYRTTWRLWIDCAWRCQHLKAPTVASLDDGRDAATKLRRLEGAHLVQIERDKLGRDMVLSFDTGDALLLFAQSTLDEQWEWRRSDGYRVGLGPGMELVERVVAPD